MIPGQAVSGLPSAEAGSDPHQQQRMAERSNIATRMEDVGSQESVQKQKSGATLPTLA